MFVVDAERGRSGQRHRSGRSRGRCRRGSRSGLGLCDLLLEFGDALLHRPLRGLDIGGPLTSRVLGLVGAGVGRLDALGAARSASSARVLMSLSRWSRAAVLIASSGRGGDALVCLAAMPPWSSPSARSASWRRGRPHDRSEPATHPCRRSPDRCRVGDLGVAAVLQIRGQAPHRGDDSSREVVDFRLSYPRRNCVSSQTSC